MQHLTLVGLSDDGKRLLLVSDKGVEFTLDVDARLRAALRGEHARLGHLEIQMDSTLRPRDIQTRIRAGETPEAVAQAAHTTVDKILPYANPVLAERAHVAQRAQRSSVRRKAGEPGARTLGEAVAGQLVPLNVDPTTVEWDAWRREDGRWSLTADYEAGRRKGTATFVFDAPGNYVVTENDDARWLVGEIVAKEPAASPRDDLRQARRRRLAAVPEDELPLGDDAIELVNDAADTVDLTEAADQVRETEADEEDVDLAPTPEPFSEPPEEADQAEAGSSEADADELEEPEEREPVKPRRPAKKRGRASVPSWDEIMFGGDKGD
jgi:hypothetical protein